MGRESISQFNLVPPISHYPGIYLSSWERDVERLNKLLLESINQLRKLNQKYHSKADMLWLWSASSKAELPSFFSKYKKRGAIVAGMDFIKGIGIAANMEVKNIPGATSYLDTNLKNKLKYAQNYLRNCDIVFIHVNAADEEAHRHHIPNKIRAIERIDHEIVGPMLQFLNLNFPDDYRIAILIDHYTLISDGTHNETNVPFAVYGKLVQKDSASKFSEEEVNQVNHRFLLSYNFAKFILNESLW